MEQQPRGRAQLLPLQPVILCDPAHQAVGDERFGFSDKIRKRLGPGGPRLIRADPLAFLLANLQFRQLRLMFGALRIGLAAAARETVNQRPRIRDRLFLRDLLAIIQIGRQISFRLLHPYLCPAVFADKRRPADASFRNPIRNGGL